MADTALPQHRQEAREKWMKETFNVTVSDLSQPCYQKELAHASTDRQTDKQTDRQTYIHTDRQTRACVHTHTHTQTHTQREGAREGAGKEER